MGIVIREYACNDCGAKFESSDAPQSVECPNCSQGEVEREFRTAPGIKSPQTTFKDRTVRELAQDYGLSDVSNKYGEAVKKAPQGPNAAQFAAATPQTMQVLSKLGSHSDSFSPVLPALQRMGGPRTWARVPDRRK